MHTKSNKQQNKKHTQNTHKPNMTTTQKHKLRKLIKPKLYKTKTNTNKYKQQKQWKKQLKYIKTTTQQNTTKHIITQKTATQKQTNNTHKHKCTTTTNY